MKARIENSSVRVYAKLPSKYTSDTLNIVGGFDQLPAEVHQQEGFFDLVTPAINNETQRLGQIYFDSQARIFTYTIEEKSQEQINREKTEQINAQANRAATSIEASLLKKLLADKIQSLPEEEVLEFRSLFKPYRIGEALTQGEKIYYPIGDKLYQVVQSHTTSLEWTPELTPALYKEIAPPGVIPDWKQPTGSHDAYQTGDKVKHKNATWECTVANNVWEPGVYGWTQIQ